MVSDKAESDNTLCEILFVLEGIDPGSGELVYAVNSPLDTRIKNETFTTLLKYGAIPQYILLCSNLQEVKEGEYCACGVKAEVLAVRQIASGKHFIIEIKVVNEVRIKLLKLLASGIGMGESTIFTDDGFERDKLKVEELIAAIINLPYQQYGISLPVFKPKITKETFYEYAYRLAFYILAKMKFNLGVDNTDTFYKSILSKLEKARDLLEQYIKLECQRDKIDYNFDAMRQDKALPLIIIRHEAKELFMGVRKENSKVKISYAQEKQLLAFLRENKAPHAKILCLPEFDINDKGYLNRKHVGILAHIVKIDRHRYYATKYLDIVPLNPVTIHSIQIANKKNYSDPKYAPDYLLGLPYRATYKEIEFRLGDPEAIQKSAQQCILLLSKLFYKTSDRLAVVPVFDPTYSNNSDYLLSFVTQVLYILNNKLSIEPLYNNSHPYVQVLEEVRSITSLDKQLKKLEDILSHLHLYKHEEELQENNVGYTDEVPKGYYPAIFEYELREVLSLFVPSKIIKSSPKLRELIFQGFYNNNRTLIILDKDELDDSFLKGGEEVYALESEVYDLLSRSNGYFEAHYLPRKRGRVNRMLLNKDGILYAKIEEVIEPQCATSEEAIALKLLVDEVAATFSEFDWDTWRNVAIPSFNPALMRLEDYAVNLSFFVLGIINDKYVGIVEKKEFFSKNVVQRLEYLLEIMDSKIPFPEPPPNPERQQEIIKQDEKLTAASTHEQIWYKLVTTLEEGSIERKKAEQEFHKLQASSTDSSEHFGILNHLVQLLNMPWGRTSKLIEDLKTSQEILNSSHFGLEQVKERVLEYLAVVQQAGTANSPILCLVGAPGLGKTSLAQTIAKATGREFIHLNLGGVDDSSYIIGHSRVYRGSTPGMIVQFMQHAGTKNPVILLDEIDKTSTRRGSNDVQYALLNVLDPKQNLHFTDHCLEIPFDLSQVMFIATANNIDRIFPALRDRLEVIDISGYSPEEKLQIAKSYIVPQFIANYKLEKDKVEFSDEAIKIIINRYTMEAGVRNLERAIETIFRKVLKASLIDKTDSIKITSKTLNEYLGAPEYDIKIEKKGEVGRTLGLSSGASGGNAITIECVKSAGQGKIRYTGNLGEVLKESVETAYSCFKYKSKELNIPVEEYEKNDLHVHLSAGATPKEGPSAGAAIYLAVVSAMAGRKIRPSLAITGEISLTGRVLGVGGLKDKLSAAQRFKLDTVLVPEESMKELEEIPKEILAELNIKGINHVDQLVDIAFEANN